MSFTQICQKSFLCSKWNTMICEKSTKMAIPSSNGSIYKFYPNLLFKHKMNKNKAYTWNKHLLNTQNGNLQEKSAISHVYPN